MFSLYKQLCPKHEIDQKIPSTINALGSMISSTFLHFMTQLINAYFSFIYFQQDVTPRIKIVVALYPFKAIESGDLSLEKVQFF